MRADVGYRELAERLNKHGLQETEVTVTGKLARGAFSAAFLLACLTVLEIENISVANI
jgi:ribosomal protein S11